MSRFHSYLANSTKLINEYKPGVPLSYHLKTFFKSEKKYGSRDRKVISSICYHYFRCFHLFNGIEFSEKLIFNAVFLCEKKEVDFLKALAPELNENIHLTVKEKLQFLNLEAADLFRFREELSASIDINSFGDSFLIQPDLFLRIRPGRKSKVIESLEKAKISFVQENEWTLRINNGANVDELLHINKDVVVQDYSSQHVFDFLIDLDIVNKGKNKISVWDACAASGGKSILLYDIFGGNIKLTVSDIRKNILSNLVNRLQYAGVNLYKKFEQDLLVRSGLDASEKFDIVVCDVPCSGSGTWSRTPEQHFSFRTEQINEFVETQRAIVSNVLPHVEKKGLFIYITCSIFTLENESMAEYIKNKFQLELVHLEYIKGYTNHADTMFVAVFKR